MLASLSPSAEDADDEEEDGCEELLVRMPVMEDAISVWPPRPGTRHSQQQQQGRLVASSVATIEGAIAAQQQREHRQQHELAEELMTTGKGRERSEEDKLRKEKREATTRDCRKEERARCISVRCYYRFRQLIGAEKGKKNKRKSPYRIAGYWLA